MAWSRQTSELELMMVAVLKKQKKPLSLAEIVSEIAKLAPHRLTGSTPRNSLYSIVYRREKRREAMGHKPQFLQEKCRGEVLFSLNPDFHE